MKTHYVPIVTSAAGSTLTSRNLQDLEIEYICVELSHLLMKPGFDILKSFTSLRRFFGWSNGLILNSALNWHSKTQTFCVKSSYDGRKITLNITEYIELLLLLKPDFVILPNTTNAVKHHLLNALVKHVTVLELQQDTLNANHLSVTYHDGKSNQYLISDHEATMGLDGHVYQQDAVINLYDKQYQLAFEIIEQSCNCSSCQQQLTLAYFHHLISHTPLLCQRLLIMHNIWHVKNKC